MRIPIHLLGAIAILLLALVGCGSSGGGDAPAAGGGATPPPAGGADLGTRSIPGGAVTVSTTAPLQPGAANVFHLVLSAGMPAPATVTAWIGTTYDPAATGIVATPVAATPGAYAVTLTLPAAPPTGSHVWVRLGFADGSVVETGNEDFLLAGP